MREQLKLYAPVLFLVILVVLLLTGACGGPSTNNIVGRWEDDRLKGVLIEFFADGKLTLGVPGVAEDGTYQIIDNDTIRIRSNALQLLAGSQDVDFNVAGDTLTLSVDGITVMKAHRTDADFDTSGDTIDDIFSNIVSNV